MIRTEFPLPEQWTGATLLMLFEHGTHIYIGTDKGLFIMDSGTQKISPSEIITKDGMKISSEVNNICMDLDGNIWISTYDVIFLFKMFYLYMYLFLAVLGLCWWKGFSLALVSGFLIAVALLVAEHWL